MGSTDVLGLESMQAKWRFCLYLDFTLISCKFNLKVLDTLQVVLSYNLNENCLIIHFFYFEDILITFYNNLQKKCMEIHVI